MFIPTAGTLVSNRYRLSHVIGRGGMGEVWRAHDQDLDRDCALKFIVQHLAAERSIRDRFAREAKAIARLRSPHVVHILSVGEVDNVPYLAMELLDGETLLTRLDRIGRLHPKVTLELAEQVADALSSAHAAGVVHRDLKPENIWFLSGNKVFIKVLDFGVAKMGLTTASLRTATGTLIGTPQYMSPEQALGNRDVDHRSDLWSLAIIIVECLTGKRPYESTGLGALLLEIVSSPPPPLKALAPELPDALQQWWERALQQDPRDRFQSASELVEALRPHLSNASADWLALQAGGPGTPAAVAVERAAALVPEAAAGAPGGAARLPQPTDPAGRVGSSGPAPVPPPPFKRTTTFVPLGGASGARDAARPERVGSVAPMSSSRAGEVQRALEGRWLVAAAAAAVLLFGVGVTRFIQHGRPPNGLTEPLPAEPRPDPGYTSSLGRHAPAPSERPPATASGGAALGAPAIPQPPVPGALVMNTTRPASSAGSTVLAGADGADVTSASSSSAPAPASASPLWPAPSGVQAAPRSVSSNGASPSQGATSGAALAKGPGPSVEPRPSPADIQSSAPPPTPGSPPSDAPPAPPATKAGSAAQPSEAPAGIDATPAPPLADAPRARDEAPAARKRGVDPEEAEDIFGLSRPRREEP